MNLLLKTFCQPDFSCALVNAYPAYVAGVLSAYSTGVGKLSLLYIAQVDTPILDNIYKKVPSFLIGPFKFTLTESERYVDRLDNSVFDITQGGRRFGL